MPRIRSISHITGNSNKLFSLRHCRQTNKVPCYCNNCNGKLVLKRTKIVHKARTAPQSHSTSDAPNPLVEIQHDAESEEDVLAPRYEDSNRQILEEEDPNRQIIDDDMWWILNTFFCHENVQKGI